MTKLLSLLLSLCLGAVAFARELPTLNRAVIDEARLLSPREISVLSGLIYELHAQGGPQLGVLILSELGGESIEDLSIKAAEKWQLGDRKKDDGLILLIALKERRMRIEVGGGIEGELTDLEAKRFIENLLTPAFRQQRYALGIEATILAIGEKFSIRLSGGSPRARRSQEVTIPPWLFAIFIVLFFLVAPFLRVLNRSGHYYGSYGGPRTRGNYGGTLGGGFRGGGGSWGGGGGFSGGGASGGW